jgi:hypothetical protein
LNRHRHEESPSHRRGRHHPASDGSARRGSASEEKGQALQNATWSPANVAAEWKQAEWPLDATRLNTLAGVRFQFTGGNHRLDIREVSIMADGKVVANDRHDGEAGDIHRGNIYRFTIPKGTAANNTLALRAVVRSLLGAQSNGKVLTVRKLPAGP